jgi:hypothetical protein
VLLPDELFHMLRQGYHTIERRRRNDE